MADVVVHRREDRGVSPATGSIQFRWKEEIIYWEDDRGYIFDGGWGADPPVTYVPSPERWDEVVPDWLRGRRDEVVSRMAQEPGHVLKDDPAFPGGGWRELTR
jgi:hypothetical protein